MIGAGVGVAQVGEGVARVRFRLALGSLRVLTGGRLGVALFGLGVDKVGVELALGLHGRRLALA